MTQDEIIRMAREAGCWETDTGELITEDISLERFFNLAFAAGAAHEREACAKVCESEELGGVFGKMCAAAIRARSE